MLKHFTACLWLVCISSTPASAAIYLKLGLKNTRVLGVINIEFDPALLTPEQKIVRRQLTSGGSISFADLRYLADMGDGYAAWVFAQRLRQLDNVSESDLAHYYAIAAAGGSNGGIKNLIRLLATPDFDAGSNLRTNWLQDVVMVWANNGDLATQQFLINAWITGTPFGQQRRTARELFEAIDLEGKPNLAIELARTIAFDGDRTEEDIGDMARYLEVAATSDSLSTRTTARQLMVLLDQQSVANTSVTSEEESQ